MSKALPNFGPLRRLHNQTQTEIAQKTGLSQQYISLIERGLPPTDEAHVEMIAAALGVLPETLRAERIRIDVNSPTGLVRVSS